MTRALVFGNGASELYIRVDSVARRAPITLQSTYHPIRFLPSLAIFEAGREWCGISKARNVARLILLNTRNILVDAVEQCNVRQNGGYGGVIAASVGINGAVLDLRLGKERWHFPCREIQSCVFCRSVRVSIAGGEEIRDGGWW